MASSMLSRVRFFDAHPLFLVEGVDPFVYGHTPSVDARNRVIRWFDDREHVIDVRDVGETTTEKLVALDTTGRRFVFVPLDVERWNQRMPDYEVASLEELEARILASSSW